MPQQDTLTIHSNHLWTLEFSKGIFVLNLNSDISGTPEEAWLWINLVFDIRDALGRPFPLMTHVEKKVQFTREGRKVMRSVEDEEYFVAHAMLTSSMARKAMVKVLMAMVPRNLFDEDIFMKEPNALQWLRTQIVESKHAPIRKEEAAALMLVDSTAPRVI